MASDVSLRRPALDIQLREFRECCRREPDRTEVSEWLLAVAMLAVGLHMLIFPSSAAASQMQSILQTFPAWLLAAVCLSVGSARVGAIARRPVSRSSLRLRAALSIASAAVWAEMLLAFVEKFWGAPPPPGFDMVLIAQLGGDLWVTLRVVRHAGALARKGLLR